ncbi:unnamed protein product [Chrysodeixis includens]|uniref:Uncharacterized protein n=1 Tax=Chrysodeixis includens TaxID=689277 RepID=A0A9N8Q0K8_CHRIL|nr:unnamed protein product [Chrysodeixis includens]
MNRYVQCSSHLFSYPATGAVTCVHTQLRATVTRTMPSIDPSSMDSKRSAKSLHVCMALSRHFAVRLHCLLADALRFISSEKRKGARKTFTCAIYARGARRQRYSEERASVGEPRTPGGSLVSPVGWPEPERRAAACVGEQRTACIYMYRSHQHHLLTQYAIFFTECIVTGTRTMLRLIIGFPSDNCR